MKIDYISKEELQHIFIDGDEYLRNSDGEWIELKYVSAQLNKDLESAYRAYQGLSK